MENILSLVSLLFLSNSLNFSVKINPAFCSESSHSIGKVPGLSGILAITFGISPLGALLVSMAD